MGCLQSYFRKGSYDVYEAHNTGLSPSPSAAAAVTAGKKDPSVGTPPGSNGHAENSGSPPPRPPPKKSHSEPKVDPSQPPALPPKRHSKAPSSGSQSGKDQQEAEAVTKVEDRNGVAGAGSGEGATLKTDGSSSGRGSAVLTPNLTSPPEEAKSTPSATGEAEPDSATPMDVVISPQGKESISPVNDSEDVTASPTDKVTNEVAAGSPANNTLISEATDTDSPGERGVDSNSSTAMSPLKKEDEESIEMSPIKKESRDGEESKSPASREAEDGSHVSSPGLVDNISPTLVVISPPEDSDNPSSPSPEEKRTEESNSEEKTEPVGEETGRPESVSGSAANSTPTPAGVPIEEPTKTNENAISAQVSQGSPSPTESAKEDAQQTEEHTNSIPSEKVQEIAVTTADRTASGTSDYETTQSMQTIKDARPTSVASEKEIESISVGSGSIVTDSGILEDKESSSEAVTRTSEEETAKMGLPNRGLREDYGLSSDGDKDERKESRDGATPIERPVSQGPVATSPGREAKDSPDAAPIEVSGVVNKSQAQTDEGSSPVTESLAGKTSPAVSLDECGNFVVKAGANTSEEKTEPTKVAEESESKVVDSNELEVEKEKSFGFGDSASLDTVVHVKTEESMELPNSSSQEKADTAASQERPASLVGENLKSVEEEMPIKETEENKTPTESESKEKDVTSPPEGKVISEKTSPKKAKETTANEQVEVPPPEVTSVVSSEQALPSPTDKSEPTSEELPLPPPPPEPEKPEQDSEEMPPPPPSEALEEPAEPSTVPPPAEATPPKSKERPLSATEEEVASILLGQTLADAKEKSEADKGVKQKEQPDVESAEQKDLPPPPAQDTSSNQESEFPPPPDMSEDGEIRSPGDEERGGRTRSASFELVEVLNLGGSVEEGEEGEQKEYREGRGLVKRVPTPVNTDWPPSQEEEDDERESISPEATATPSVTSESKQSLEDEGTAKLQKDTTSGSLEEIPDPAADVATQAAPESEGEVTKETTSPTPSSPIKESQEQSGAKTERKEEVPVATTTITSTDTEVKPMPEPSAPEEDLPAAEGKAVENAEALECIVTNQGPPLEVLEAMEKKLEEEKVSGEEEVEDAGGKSEEEERAKSAEEERREVEEVIRREVDEVIRKAVVEAEKRDRESKMSGEVDDTVVVEAAVEDEPKDAETKDVNSGKDEVVEEAVKHENDQSAEAGKCKEDEKNGEDGSNKSEDKTEESNMVTVDSSAASVGSGESKTKENDTKPLKAPKKEISETDRTTGKEIETKAEATVDTSSTKIQANEKSRSTSEMNGETKPEPPQSEAHIQSPDKKTIDDGGAEGRGTPEGVPPRGDGGYGPAAATAGGVKEETADPNKNEEEAAAVKIQSTFRGFVVRRDAAGKGRGGGKGREKEGGVDGEGTGGGGGEKEEEEEEEGAASSKCVPSEAHSHPAERPERIGGEDEDEKVWRTLDEERREQAASCIQRNFREFRDIREGGARLRREDALVSSSSGSAGDGHLPAVSAAAAPAGRTSGEFHDHVVLPPLETAALSTETTGRMREDCGVPEATGVLEDSGEPHGGAARGIMDSAAARIQAGYRGYRVRKRLREVQNNGGPRVSPQNDIRCQSAGDPKEGEAATKIQAGVRGFLTRRRLKRRREEDCENNGAASPEEMLREATAEAEKAAVKIQAGFRGYKSRQKVKARRQQEGKKEVK